MIDMKINSNFSIHKKHFIGSCSFLYISSDNCLHATAELSSCNKDHTALKAYSICYLALYTKFAKILL